MSWGTLVVYCVLGSVTYYCMYDIGLQHEEEEQHDLELELEDVRSRQAELPGVISQVQEALNGEASSLFRKKAKADSKESVQKDLEKGLGKIIDCYTRELGLTLSPMHGGIEVRFTQIDGEYPDRSFTVHILCGKTGEYSGMHSCVDVEGYMNVIVDYLNMSAVDSKSPCAADVGQLVEDLNATGDFSTFVLNIRKVFVDSCRR